MTAIAGLVRLDEAPIDRAAVGRMLGLLAPYGRDAQQSHVEPGAAFVRTLLRVSPEDALDRQPLVHAPTGTVLVFDGRLDNRGELAEALGVQGAETRLLSDAELVLQACLRWDTETPARLLGDFALACWQPRARRLWLARDPLGLRPLYWHRQPGFFAFASLPKALFALPGVDKALCEARLHDFLCLLPMMGPESFFKDVYRVEPAHVVLLEDGRQKTWRYHAWDLERRLELKDDDAYLEAFGEQLERAVACRLRSAGPLASHLSSGFDSSTVTALAARQLRPLGGRLIAYTAVPREGFDGPVSRWRHADEGPAAAALARRFPNIEHVLVRSGGSSPLDGLDGLTDSLDRPALNPCNAVWSEAIKADAAARGVRVLLTGARGNMSISYTGEPWLAQLVAQGRWWRWWREARALKAREPGRRWRGLLVGGFGPWLPRPLWRLVQHVHGKGTGITDYSAIHPEWLARMDHVRRARAAGWDTSYRPWADGRRMRVAVLERLDNGEHGVASNAYGLEERDPTADRRLIEFCLALPDEQFLRDGRTRWLLRRLMQEVLPPEILDSPTRGQQAADWYETTAGALPRIREELARLREQGAGRYLDLDALARSLERWPESGWAAQRTVQTYRLKLLRGLSVGTFIRQVEGGNG